MVEGETEDRVIRRLRDQLSKRLTPDAAIAMLNMRGVDGGLSLAVAFAASPLIERSEGDHWLLSKPPTSVLVMVDPESRFSTPDKAEKQRSNMVDAIVSVVRAQGVDPDRGQLDGLVRVETWTESCFEFEHFTDSELADGLLQVHPLCGGLSRNELQNELVVVRSARRDIKRVWSQWIPQVSKIALADALWPVFERKVEVAFEHSGAPSMAIADHLADALHEALMRPPGRWALMGTAVD